MLKIGDFSKLTQVSVKTLHYYDEIGLLKPNQIDHSSGYRYYSIKQLPRLNRILAYKDLGFSLEQIAQLLDDNLSTEKIQGMLKLKQAEVAQLIEAEQARLKRIESRLRQIEQEDKLSDYVITTKRLASQRVLSVRKHLATYSELPQLLDELYNFAQQHKLSSETLLVTWHDQRFK